MTPSVALAHDVLAARAGGERVLAALASGFADAPIHTLIYEPNATFDEFERHTVHTSWLNRITPLRRRYRAALPVAALTWAARCIDADVTVCSTSGLSHHVRTTGARVVYCHTPARWLHQPELYLDGFPRTVSTAARVVSPLARRFDRTAMRSADIVIANSQQTRTEIQDIYGIDARVIAPASFLDLEGPVRPIRRLAPGFVVSPMRPLAYKRFDVLIAAARRRPEVTFLQIGDGPHRTALVADAPANLHSVGGVDDAQLRWAYRNARAVLLTCAEDFGLVPLEAAAHGLTTIAPRARGLLDHDPAVVHPYEFASVDELVTAVDDVVPPTGVFDSRHLGVDRFLEEIRRAIDDALVVNSRGHG